jgi:hypothetical protein
MTLLWTLIGLNPVYETICGLAEVTAALLLFFRRTALAGALLAGFVMSNVLLYNMFFDVPVKIYAAHLVLFSIAVVAPDLRALLDFFWFHRPAAPTGVWVPPAERRHFVIGTRIVEFTVVLLFTGQLIQLFHGWRHQQASIRNPTPLTGEWQVSSAMLNVNGKLSPKPLLTGDGAPLSALFLEPSGRTMARSADGVLWRSGVELDAAKHTFQLFLRPNDPILYSMAQPDPTHLVLTPTGKQASSVPSLQLTRIPLPAHYPLLDRGFHLVNEWGLER